MAALSWEYAQVNLDTYVRYTASLVLVKISILTSTREAVLYERDSC